MTLVDAILAGQIAPGDIKSIRIYKGDKRWWAGSKEAYARMESRDITSAASVASLHSIFLNNTVYGTGPWNHPGTNYKGYMRVVLHDGTEYYAYYLVLRQSGILSMQLQAIFEGETDPNRATEYGSSAFLKFLRQYDPWFSEHHVKETGPLREW
ncbi:MAG: hypothetical protein ACYS9X_25310 [Planctomycetota bacterium]|jgi:hypothetical protein